MNVIIPVTDKNADGAAAIGPTAIAAPTVPPQLSPQIPSPPQSTPPEWTVEGRWRTGGGGGERRGGERGDARPKPNGEGEKKGRDGKEIGGKDSERKGSGGNESEGKGKEGATPGFVKSRPVPFALLDKIENELDLLVNEGILSKVDNSLWASPIVPVSKSNGDIRICGDFKVSINQYLLVDEYQLPTIDELLATMAGGDKSTKIDLSRAYLQLEVAPEDRHLLTLNTHKGLYQANRLLYGVASAPAIWQREIEKILQRIPGVSVFLDDIKITGSDDTTHLARLNLVFERLKQ
ncbi:Reverse transcriptase (RNA-dependent DNA polymerase) [Popillia japonica]|uniref:Reverse transcriptase (RNA-dependent DNA polymerase) n=1 Tax=Popillia japonica TaxID=7064 RepID=A0AAW1HWW0_POPJA